MLRDTDVVLTADNPALKVIYRLDAGYDTPTNRRALLDGSRYFLLKAHDTRLARKLAQHVPLQDWLPVDERVHGTELEPLNGYRRLLYEFFLPEGTLEYFLMYSNLPADEFGVQRCFTFYNERQTIEAFFGQSRHVYNIQNLRSRKFNAIYAFLRFVFLTHNLIHWTKQAHFAQTDLAHATTRMLIQHIARVRARWTWTGPFNLFILPSNRWAALLLEALQPRPIQLELPFARLHKT